MAGSSRAMAAASFLVLCTLGAARAAEKRDCNGIGTEADMANVALGVVTADRVTFLVNESDKPGYPSASAACKRRAFVLKGNKVAIDTDAQGGAYVCAAFINTHGEESDGWLPAASVTTVAVVPDWIGTWKRNATATIDVTRKSATRVEVDGTATWGQGAATHEGGIDGIIDPTRAVQAFASDGDKQMPFEKAGEYDCAVRLKQVGTYLFVSDNGWCGGANVTFDGLYARR